MPPSPASRRPANDPIVQVAVPGPFPEPLDYLDRSGIARPGCRVDVPLGRRRVVGLAVSRSAGSDYPRNKLKSIMGCIDDEPLLPPVLMSLLGWTADYYHHPLGDTLGNALPGLLRRGASLDTDIVEWRLSNAGRELDTESLSRAPRQQEVINRLAEGPLLQDELSEHAAWRDALKRLRDKGFLEQSQRAWVPASGTHVPGPTLSDEQAAAVSAIHDSGDRFAVVLLQGVTGSGKTEVYLEAIEALLPDQQALVLVPEIALTPQLLARFDRLGLPTVSLHSAMAEGERRRAWAAARAGTARIVIGTRSAVFTPMQNLGLIVVDEEHDGSFKQQDGLRYHARDVAVRRAQLEGVPVVLGSATPSLESLANVEADRYSRVLLRKRAGAGRPPAMRVVDLRGQPVQAGLSPPLIQAIDRHLGDGNQVMLFLNRRGYAPAMLCHDCGWNAECRRCDARLTVHQRAGELRCHHCGAQQPMPAQCPDCGEEQLISAGQGTERIEERICRLFPDAGVARLDRDSTRRRGSLEQTLDSIRDGKAQIVIGTQMLAKGHDFPNVTLAAVVNADGGLFAVDFRAAERMAQLITQFAGRAGRGGQPGEVIVQTHQPEHELLRALIGGGYEAFVEAAITERRDNAMPPFSHLALLRAEAVKEPAAREFLQASLSLGNKLKPDVLSLWGPAPAPMLRRGGRYRLQLLIHAPDRPLLHRFLRQWLPQVQNMKQTRRVRWSIDIDPQDLY